MPKIFTSKSQKTGELGEEIVVKYLIKKNFTVVERNFYKKIGEIDIIARENNILHFIEVKSVSHETKKILTIKPEDNFTRTKSRKFRKIIEYYLVEKAISRETLIQIDLITVYLDSNLKIAKVKPFWNIIL